MSDRFELTDESPVYVISVAAQLAGMHPQTLRQYDRLGLVSPDRTAGRGRRYSLRDVELLREVQRLSQEGVNLAGIKRLLAMQQQVARLANRLARLEQELSAAHDALRAAGSGQPSGGERYDIVRLRDGGTRPWQRPRGM
ncbi:MAG: heat shock protein transcriptional repressor HspR [Streptosporangiales bacterium]